MTVEIIGSRQLRARLEAIKPDEAMMRAFAVAATEEQKRLVPRRTGNLGRSIRIGAVSASYAETVATANYSAYVEFGTRAHDIVPVRAKALRWPAKGSSTLSGRVRKGGTAIFAKRVKHPGTRAQPFMLPGAEKGIEKIGLKPITDKWDRAA